MNVYELPNVRIYVHVHMSKYYVYLHVHVRKYLKTLMHTCTIYSSFTVNNTHIRTYMHIIYVSTYIEQQTV